MIKDIAHPCVLIQANPENALGLLDRILPFVRQENMFVHNYDTEGEHLAEIDEAADLIRDWTVPKCVVVGVDETNTNTIFRQSGSRSLVFNGRCSNTSVVFIGQISKVPPPIRANTDVFLTDGLNPIESYRFFEQTNFEEFKDQLQKNGLCGCVFKYGQPSKLVSFNELSLPSPKKTTTIHHVS